jgi:hypothetical protein
MVLDVSMAGLPNRVFANVSLGLEDSYEMQRQCTSNGRLRFHTRSVNGKNEMHFTPNRRTHNDTVHDAEHQRLQLGFVLVVGGHTDNNYDYGPSGSVNGLMSVWDSWLEYFFTYTSNTSSIVLLFDERDFLKQNITRSRKEYLDSILIWNMGAEPCDCVTLENKNSNSLPDIYKHYQIHSRKRRHSHVPRNGPASLNHSHITRRSNFFKDVFDCTNELNLDYGYRVYYIDVAHANGTHQLPLILFAAIHR